MQPFNLSITHYPELPNAKLMYLEGDFDKRAEEAIAKIQYEIEEAVLKSMLIFELSKLNYMNSFVVSELIAWHKAIQKKQGDILIVGINEHLLDIFKVQEIDAIFKLYSDLEELKKAHL